ncbi:hypothetical protein ACIQH9_11365 [Pseudarthrobacter oxydans]|uniref:hypothetical protein n=1 Tax=Pseudarthrobacter oxydans TaxID=1671 RepID=UPI00381B3ED1
MSNIHTRPEMGDPDEYPRGIWPSALLRELTGFETAKISRTQRSNPGQATSGFGGQQNGNQGAQSVQQDDPWGPPTANAAPGWGNRPDSEPPF